MIPRLRVLYVAYWGALEPLGQALVLPAIRRFARHGVKLTLVSFDKPRDLTDPRDVAELRSSLEACGVRWINLRYHKKPTLPATAWDVLHGALRSVLRGGIERPQVVHARTFVGGVIGAIAATLLRVPYVFHSEGFFPDERVDGGAWSPKALAYQLSTRIERRLFNQASAIIVLSEKARRALPLRPGLHLAAKPVIVVPSCVDLDRFHPAPPRPVAKGGPLRLVYTGNVELRYQFEEIAQFVAATQRLRTVRLRVLTRADHGRVHEALRRNGVADGSWTVAEVPHEQVPSELREQDAGLFFLRRGLSEHGCSPTKVGEYWASGLPVVLTANAGDTDTIALQAGAGVVVHDHSPPEHEGAARRLMALLEDPHVSSRCRAAAETHYSLSLAVARQLGLYSTLLAQEDSTAPPGLGARAS